MRDLLSAALVACLLAACGGPGPDASAESPPRVASGSAAARGSLPAAPDRPVDDLVLITIDTLRADALGFMGNDAVATPALDRLAAGGWAFDSARAHNVVTLPSHANILTGLHPYEHGIRDNTGFVLPDSIPTAATLLAAAGFATGAFVAAFPLDSRFGLDRGFEIYDDEYGVGSRQSQLSMPERRGDLVVGRALEWWRRQGDRRRFLWLHLYDPHAPYAPPEPYRSRHPTSPYLGEVEAVDHFLEPLLAQFLPSSARAALVVVTSDHGEALGDHGETSHGLFAYEATLKVPLVLWGAGIGSGRSQVAARHVDILPTLLVAAGIEAPATLAGRPLFAGTAPGAGPTTQYFEALTSTFNSGFAPLRGVVVEGHKFISLPLPELYDLAADPGESRNLVEVEAERGRVRRLMAALPVESAWPPERGAVSDETAATLRSLGYLSGSESIKESYSPEDDPKTLVGLDRKMHEVIDASQRGEVDRAERLVREVIAERPAMSLAWFSLTQMLLDRDQRREAIAVMQEADRLGVAKDSLVRQLGLTLAEEGRFPEALAVLERFGATDDPDVSAALGLILSEAGRQSEARKVLTQLLESDPGNVIALERLALVALRDQRWAEARSHAEAALAIDPALGEAWNYLGTARYNTGDPRGAVEAWERAVAARSDNYDALFNLALVAGQIGDGARARRALERFIAGAPPERYGRDLERARELLGQLPS